MNLVELKEKIVEQSNGCHEQFIDISNTKIEDTENCATLLTSTVSSSLVAYKFLKIPDEKPLPLKQLCSASRVPFSFFMESTSNLNDKIFGEWLPKAKKPERLIKYRVHEADRVARAVLPEKYETITFLELINDIMPLLEEQAYTVAFFHGDNLDDIAHLRFLLPEEYEIDEELYQLGFSLYGSEVADVPFIVDSVLYKVSECTSIVLPFGDLPYLKQKCRKLTPSKIKEAIIGAMSVALECRKYIINCVSDAGKKVLTIDDVYDLIKDLRLKKGCPSSFLKMVQELLVENIPENPDNLTLKYLGDLMCKLSDLLPKYDKRLWVEREVSNLYGIRLVKNEKP